MIKDTKALSMAESVEYAKPSKDEGKEVIAFIKKFSKTSAKDGKELRSKLEGMDLMKLEEKSISKIIDILPENPEELGKIFVGLSLDEEESKKILDAVKEFK